MPDISEPRNIEITNSLPIPYVTQYTDRTPVIAPLVLTCIRLWAVAMLEWGSLRFIDHAPVSVWIASSVIAAFVLVVLEKRDWLNFKDKRYFPISLLSLLALWICITLYGYYFDNKQEPIQSQLESAIRQRDAATSDAATLRRQLENVGHNAGSVAAPTGSSQATLSAEDIATKMGVWESVSNSNTRELTMAYNSLDLPLSQWVDRIKTPDGRHQLYNDLINSTAAYMAASNDLDILRSEYPNYQDISDALAQPHRSELQRVAANFANAVSKIPDNPQPNFDIQLRPLAGALRREMDATQAWLTGLVRTAGQSRKLLSETK